MENLICNLLEGYEQGALTRRQLVQRLLVLTVATARRLRLDFRPAA